MFTIITIGVKQNKGKYVDLGSDTGTTHRSWKSRYGRFYRKHGHHKHHIKPIHDDMTDFYDDTPSRYTDVTSENVETPTRNNDITHTLNQHAETPILINSNGQLVPAIELNSKTLQNKPIFMISSQTENTKPTSTKTTSKPTTSTTKLTTTTTTTPKPTTTTTKTTPTTTTITTTTTTTATTPTTTTSTTKPVPTTNPINITEIIEKALEKEREEFEDDLMRQTAETEQLQKRTRIPTPTDIYTTHTPTTTPQRLPPTAPIYIEVYRPTFRSETTSKRTYAHLDLDTLDKHSDIKSLIITPHHDDVEPSRESYRKVSRSSLRENHGSHVHGEQIVTTVHEDRTPDEEEYRFVKVPTSHKHAFSPVDETDKDGGKTGSVYAVKRKNKHSEGLLVGENKELDDDVFGSEVEVPAMTKNITNPPKTLMADLEKLETNHTDKIKELLSDNLKNIVSEVRHEVSALKPARNKTDVRHEETAHRIQPTRSPVKSSTKTLGHTARHVTQIKRPVQQETVGRRHLPIESRNNGNNGSGGNSGNSAKTINIKTTKADVKRKCFCFTLKLR